MRWIALALLAACGGDGDRTYNAGPDRGDPQPSPLVEVPKPELALFVHHVAFTPDGRWLLGMTSGVLTVWELDAGDAALDARGWFGLAETPGTPDPVARLERWLEENEVLHDYAVSPDGKEVIAVGPTAAGRWRLHPARAEVATLLERAPHEGEIHEVAIAPDGRRMLVAERGEVESWQVDGLARRDALALPELAMGVAFTADGRRAVVAGAYHLWLVGVDREGDLALLETVERRTFWTAIEPLGGDRFVIGGKHGELAIGRVEEDHLIVEPELPAHHREQIVHLARLDGGWAASSFDGTATLWADGGDAPAITIELPDEHETGLAIHPHGPWLATAGGDGLRVWRYRRDAIR
jgi:hypothetical protein